MVALVASFVCLPILALQLLDGAGATSSAAMVATTDAQQPSLVVATAPATTAAVTTSEPTVEVTDPTDDTRPPTTTAAPTTTAPRPTTTASAPATTAAPAPPPPAPAVSSGSDWDRLAQCESGGNWAMNSGNGYSGGLQFLPDTWSRNGGAEFAPMAYQASREAQIAIAERLWARQGWGAWPGCSRKLGLL